MNKLLQILKINILSLISLPFLILATGFRMLSQAIVKINVVIGMLVLLLAGMLISEFVKNPSSIGKLVLTIVILFVFFGLLCCLIIFLLALSGAAYMWVVNMLTGIADFLHEKSYSVYAKLFDDCKITYNNLETDKNKLLNVALVFWWILKGVNWIIIKIMSFAFLIACAGGIGILLYVLVRLNQFVNNELGLSFLKYLSMFGKIDLFFSILTFLMVFGSIIVILITLGSEWSEWGRELEFATSNYANYITWTKTNEQVLQENKFDAETMQFNGTENQSDENRMKLEEYLKILGEHKVEYGEFSNEITQILMIRQNAILASDYHEYSTILIEVVEDVKLYLNQITLNKVNEWIPKINKCEKLKESLKKEIVKIKTDMETAEYGGATFFSGCNSKMQIDKRYKALCRAYHPDGEAGDEETFKKMKNEYEELIKE